MFRHRDFDMVMVSTNLPDEKAGVMKSWNGSMPSGRNLLFGSDDTYAMQAAFDPKWDSRVPYTVLLETNGKVLYRENRRG